MNTEVDGTAYPETKLSLAAEVSGQVDEVKGLPRRIARYGTAKRRALEMAAYLDQQAAYQVGHHDLARRAWRRLVNCGEYLHFRKYYTVSKVRLHSANFCKQHLICPLCAIRRGAKNLEAYLERYKVIHTEHPELRLYLITFTVRNGPDLDERFGHLAKSFKVLQQHRHRWLSKVRGAPWTELCKVQGAVGAYEVTNQSKGWHPHLHMITLCAEEPVQADLKAEWEKLTGDSFMVDVTPFDVSQEPVEGFLEVFKYSVKFAGLSLEHNWEAALAFSHRRLLFSFGLFRGVQVPEELTDEPVLDDLPYIDLFYRWLGGAIGYSLEAVDNVCKAA